MGDGNRAGRELRGHPGFGERVIASMEAYVEAAVRGRY